MWVGQYILDENGEPQPEPDGMKWALWFEHSHKSKGKDNRIICSDYIGSVHVSTVFLGLDHSFEKKGKPVLWETMIFGGEHDQYMRRYRSKDDAIIGHHEALGIAKGSQKDLQELERMALAGGWEKK